MSLGAGLISAQNTNSGDVRGTVSDSSGAVVPEAMVTVTNIDTGVAKAYKTNGVGLYDTGPIIAGHYTITVTKSGFDTFVRGPVTLDVETVTINGSLKIGAVSETVRVTSDAPLLQTESGAQGTTLGEREMQELPNFASWENFIVLAPGTAGSPEPGAGNGMNPGQTASVNGNAVFYNVLGDGVTMSFPSNGNAYDYNFDQISEVQMITSSFSAQYENGGVIYNQISKSGTSKFHGDLFEYFSNNALNAAPFGFGQPSAAPVLHANYFGGSIGGPIPGKLRDKLFFFFNYNRSQNYGGAANGFFTVPTEAMRYGDFAGQPTIYNPATQTINSSGVLHRQPFAGNIIPASMISNVAKAIQQYFPAPNVSNPTVTDGITTNNFFYNVPTNSPSWSTFWRVDYNLTANHRLTVTDYYNWGQNDQLSPDCPINCTNASGTGRTTTLTYVSTLSPTKVNEFRLGVTTQSNLYVPETLDKGYPAKLGLQFAKADLFPEVNISGACCWELQPGTNAIQHQIMYTPSDVFTLILGKHVLHFGGELLIQQINTTFWGNIDAGNLTFGGVYTNATQGDTATGLPYADFLLGDVQSWSAANTPEFYPRMTTGQLFTQDDIKLRPNLTLNVGIRWEGWGGLYEKENNERSWDPTIVNPATNPLGEANTLGAMWYGTTRANGRTKAIAPNWNTYLPRLGASWHVRPNTVIRGGIGLFAYNYNEGPNAYNELGSEFGQSGNLTDTTNGISPVVTLNQNGSVNDQGAGGSSINSVYVNAPTGPAAYNGQAVNFAQYHEPLSKIWQYNVEVQQQLTSNLVLNAAYVGSHGYDQMFGVDLNQVPESKLGPNDATGSTNARPYPNFQSIGGNEFVGISNYNALQTTIEKRLSDGLQFNFNYTFSKYLDESEPCAWNCAFFTVQNMYEPRENYGPAAFDITHMFKGRLVYDLPVGKGKTFLNSNNFVAQALGGWSTSGTIQWQSGNPFTPYMDVNNSYSQAGFQTPNLVGDPTSGPHGTINEWFNVAAFAQPAAGTYGNVGRDVLRGPGLSDVNFQLSKNFLFGEKVRLVIRAAATNVLNHPSFGLPDHVIGTGHTAQITSVTVGGRTMQLVARISF